MLLLVKIRNAGELLWESLDTQERILLAYLLATVAVSVLGSAQRRSREKLKQELREEILGGLRQ